MPRSDRLDNEDGREVVCPAPQRTLALSLPDWNTQMDLGMHAAFLPQQGALPEEQCWAADGCVSQWPVQAAEYPFANGTAAGFDATFMYGAVNKDIEPIYREDIEPIYREDSSATYNAGNWVRCGADGSGMCGDNLYVYGDNLYVYGDNSYVHGGNSYVYGDNSYGDNSYGDNSYGDNSYGDNSNVYGDSTCMYGMGVFAINSTAGTTVGSGPSPSRNTTVERHSTTTTTPMTTTMTTTPMVMATPGDRNCHVPNSFDEGTSSYTASSTANYEPIPTESPSESSSFEQTVPANAHLQTLNAASMGITNTSTWQETGELMSPEELDSLLERHKDQIFAI
jgi:hypothetical protein